MDKKEIFEKAPVHKAVFSMALPTILSMIVIILYNMADTFFVGQTHNSLYVSAVSLASPVFLIFTAFSSMFGAGGSSVISRALGTGEKEKAKSKKSQRSCLLCLHPVRDYHERSCIAGNGFHFEDSRYG